MESPTTAATTHSAHSSNASSPLLSTGNDSIPPANHTNPKTPLARAKQQQPPVVARHAREVDDNSQDMSVVSSGCLTCLRDGATQCCRSDQQQAQCYHNSCMRLIIEVIMATVVCGIDVGVDLLYDCCSHDPEAWHHFAWSFSSIFVMTLVIIALHSHCYAPKTDDAPREPLKGCAKVKHWVVEHYCTATIVLAIPSTVLMGELFIAKYMHDWDTKSMKAHALDRSILAFLQFILTLMGLHIDTCYCIRKLQQINHTMSSMVELQPLNRNGDDVDNEEKNDDNDNNPVNLIIKPLFKNKLQALIREQIDANHANDNPEAADNNDNPVVADNNNNDDAVFIRKDHLADELEEKEPRAKIHVMIDNKLKNVATKQSVTLLQEDHDKLANNHNKLAVDHNKLAVNHDKLTVDHDKLAVDHDKLAVDHDKLAVDHDKLAADHNKLSDEHKELASTVDDLSGQQKQMASKKDLDELKLKFLMFSQGINQWIEQQEQLKAKPLNNNNQKQ